MQLAPGRLSVKSWQGTQDIFLSKWYSWEWGVDLWMFSLSTELITKGKLATIKRFECWWRANARKTSALVIQHWCPIYLCLSFLLINQTIIFWAAWLVMNLTLLFYQILTSASLWETSPHSSVLVTTYLLFNPPCVLIFNRFMYSKMGFILTGYFPILSFNRPSISA